MSYKINRPQIFSCHSNFIAKTTTMQISVNRNDRAHSRTCATRRWLVENERLGLVDCIAVSVYSVVVRLSC